MDFQHAERDGDRRGLGVRDDPFLHLLRGDEQELWVRKGRRKCIVLKEIIPAELLCLDMRNLGSTRGWGQTMAERMSG